MTLWLVKSPPGESQLVRDLPQLHRQILPAGWSWVNASVYAKVAVWESATPVYYKAFLPRNRWETPKAWLRGSRCQRAIAQATLLTDKGFSTPAIIAWGKLSGGREFMLTQAVNGIGMGSCIASYFRQVKTPRLLSAKRALIKALGEQIGRLHQTGIVHGDLRPNNVLLELGQYPHRFHFIDNERNQRYRKIPAKLLRKNLVQIGMLAPVDLSIHDRMRFFKAYLTQAPALDRSQQRKLIADVYRVTMKRLAGKNPDKQGSPYLPKHFLDDGLILPSDDTYHLSPSPLASSQE